MCLPWEYIYIETMPTLEHVYILSIFKLQLFPRWTFVYGEDEKRLGFQKNLHSIVQSTKKQKNEI